MSYTLEDFKHDYIKEHFKDLTPEEQREIIRSLPPKERLKGLPPKERLEDLSIEDIRKHLKKLKAAGSSRPRQRRRKD